MTFTAKALIGIALAVVIGVALEGSDAKNEAVQGSGTPGAADSASARQSSSPKGLQQDGVGAVNARKAYARELEDKLLDAGINAHVKTLGPAAETLKVDYHFAGRVMGHSLGKNADLFAALSTLQFSLMRLEGYSYIAQWYPDRGGWAMQEHESEP